MRELKFKIWRTEDKCWGDPAALEVFNSSGKLEYLYQDQENIIQQYTGLKDAKGKEIYEGDILLVETDESSPHEFLYVVDFYDGSYNHPYVYRRMKGSDTVEVVGRAAEVNYMKYLIIGNIYENPLKIL